MSAATPAAAAVASIPVFDLSEPNSSQASALLSAATTYGFLYIRAEPFFPAEAVNRTFSLSRDFFSLPISTKAGYPMRPDNRGWTAAHEETLDPATQAQGDPKEAFNFGEFTAEGTPEQPVPPVFASAAPHLSDFMGRCRALCARVLEELAEGLQMEERGWFSERHDRARGASGTILRLLHYPPAQKGERGVQVRAGAHSDYGSMTLLFREARRAAPGPEGLEILTPEGAWAPVPIVPAGTEADAIPPVLVNIGDLLSFWTGGLLKSTVHRVAFAGSDEPGPDRYSIAFFCHPARDTRLVPVPSPLVRDHVRALGGKHAGAVVGAGSGTALREAPPPITADEHLQRRLGATYGWDA